MDNLRISHYLCTSQVALADVKQAFFTTLHWLCDHHIMTHSMKRKDGFYGSRAIVLPQMLIDQQRNDELTQSLYITDIGYYPHAENHFRKRLLPISEHVLIYCVEGEGWYEVDNTKYILPENHFCILPAGKPHAYGASERNPWTIYWIHFAGAQADIFARNATKPLPIHPGNSSRINYRNTIFEEIYSTLSKTINIESLRYASSVLHYYLASMRYLSQYRAKTEIKVDITEAIKHYMAEHIAHRMQLEELAKYTGYSIQHLSARFKSDTGISPLAYFNRMKIEYAANLLETTDIKVNQVCHKVGIEDAYYFSRMFKLMKGMSPREWKKMHNRECMDHS